MNLEQLTQLLAHPQARYRLVAIHTIDLVDEVRALDAISERIPLEPEAHIEDIFKQVGRRLMALKKDGYDTITALCEQYNVYSEVLSYADDAELKKIQHMVNSTTDKRKGDDFNNQALNIAALAIGGRALGPTALVGSAMPPPGSSSNLSSLQDNLKKLKRRVRPVIPTETDISRWAKLLQSYKPDDRKQALVQMKSANNPAALQYFAHIYAKDREEDVRETAKRLGRSLYWNLLYYELEQSGEIRRIMQEFAASLGVTLPAETETKRATGVHEDIGDILKKAQENRKRRGLNK